MPAPVSDYTWATDATWSAVGEAWDGLPTKVDPSPLRPSGYRPEPLIAQYLNGHFAILAEWLAYLADRVDNVNAGETLTVAGDLDVTATGEINVAAGGLLTILFSGPTPFRIYGAGVASLPGMILGSGAGILCAGTGPVPSRWDLSETIVTIQDRSRIDLLNGVLNVGRVVPSVVSGQIAVYGAAGGTGGQLVTTGELCLSLGGTGSLSAVLTAQNEGRIQRRVVNGPGASGNVEPDDGDILIASGHGADIVWTLINGAHGDEITLVNRNGTYKVTVYSAAAIKLPFGTTPIELLNASGYRQSITLVYSSGGGGGAGWYTVAETYCP